MKYVFVNIFTIQREKYEHSNTLFIYIETIHIVYNLSSLRLKDC